MNPFNTSKRHTGGTLEIVAADQVAQSANPSAHKKIKYMPKFLMFIGYHLSMFEKIFQNKIENNKADSIHPNKILYFMAKYERITKAGSAILSI